MTYVYIFRTTVTVRRNEGARMTEFYPIPLPFQKWCELLMYMVPEFWLGQSRRHVGCVCMRHSERRE